MFLNISANWSSDILILYMKLSKKEYGWILGTLAPYYAIPGVRQVLRFLAGKVSKTSKVRHKGSSKQGEIQP